MNPAADTPEIAADAEIEATTAALEARAEARRIAVRSSLEARRAILDRIAEAA